MSVHHPWHARSWESPFASDLNFRMMNARPQENQLSLHLSYSEWVSFANKVFRLWSQIKPDSSQTWIVDLSKSDLGGIWQACCLCFEHWSKPWCTAKFYPMPDFKTSNEVCPWTKHSNFFLRSFDNHVSFPNAPCAFLRGFWARIDCTAWLAPMHEANETRIACCCIQNREFPCQIWPALRFTSLSWWGNCRWYALFKVMIAKSFIHPSDMPANVIWQEKIYLA